MFTTLNNTLAKHIIICALDGMHRFCAYSLYNHYIGCTFSPEVMKRLAELVRDFLGENFDKMKTDDCIDWCVRDFIHRYYDGFFN